MASVNEVKARTNYVITEVKAEGNDTEGQGKDPKAPGKDSKAQGNDVGASGNDADAQGNDAGAPGNDAEAQGNDAGAQGNDAEAQGNGTRVQVQGARLKNLLTKLQPSIEQSPDHPAKILQAIEGIKAIKEETDGPALKRWKKFSTVATNIIFTLSVLSSIISLSWNSITKELYNPAIDITAMVLVLIDIILFILYLTLEKLPAYKRLNKEQKECFEKCQDWFDNLVSEWLLYPATIFSVISISSQRLWIRDYTDPTAITRDDFYAVWDVLFALFDMITLFSIYGQRIYLIRLLVIRLKNKFGNDVMNVGGCCGCDNITGRIIYFSVANAMLFLFMVVQIFMQVYNDNLPENKPLAHLKQEQELGNGAEVVYMQGWTIVMLLLTLYLPLVNLLAFLCSNSYYILLFLIDINRLGSLAAGTMGEEQANDMKSLNLFQRLSFSSRVWWMNLVLFFWTMLFAVFTMVFSRYYIQNIEISSWSTSTPSQQTYAIIYIFFYVLSIALLLSANSQSFAAVGVGSFIAIIRIISIWFTKPTPPPTPSPTPPLTTVPLTLMWVEQNEGDITEIAISSKCSNCKRCGTLQLKIEARPESNPTTTASGKKSNHKRKNSNKRNVRETRILAYGPVVNGNEE